MINDKVTEQVMCIDYLGTRIKINNRAHIEIEYQLMKKEKSLDQWKKSHIILYVTINISLSKLKDIQKHNLTDIIPCIKDQYISCL